MSDPEKSQINKDFNVAKQAAEMQKSREEQVKELLNRRNAQRLEKVKADTERIKDDKARQQADLSTKEALQKTAEKLERLVKAQQDKINREVQKSIDKQKSPQPTPKWLTSKKTPQQIHDIVAAYYKAQFDRERITTVNNQFDARVEPVEKGVQQTVQREQAQERQRKEQIKNRLPEQVFEKSVEEKSAKDAFSKAHDRNEKKSWQQLRGERGQGENEL